MEFLDSFFEDEVRDGFFVPAMVKRGWAAEMEVLSEIDRICKKYDIPYFAEYGSMLGVIRHKGFIPWDDDLDIGMRRADYNRFVEVAKKEFDGKFHLFTYKTHKDFWHFLARVTSSTKICFEEEYLDKFHQFPYITGVDIFVLDNICNDEKREKERNTYAKYIIEAADIICTEDIGNAQIEQHLSRVEDICNVKIPREYKFYLYAENDSDLIKVEKNYLTYEERKYKLRAFLYELAEKLFAKFENEACDNLGRIMPDALYGNGKKISKKYYDNLIRLPFENITIPVPIAYDEMLKKRYGNYMKIIKNVAGHDYPFFATQQKQLDEVLKREGVEGIKGYEFDKEVLIKQEIERDEAKNNSYKKLVTECASEIDKMHKVFTKSFDNKEIENTMAMLAELQQVSIDLGNLLEQVREDGFGVIKYIENYCEKLFLVYEDVSKNIFEPEKNDQLQIALALYLEQLDKKILSKKEVVIVVSQYRKWRYIKDVYAMLLENEKYNISVITVPYYYKKYDGSFSKMVYEEELFSEEIATKKYDEYDFGLMHPDKIIIQTPYDGYNATTSIHQFFYSDNLKKYTDELIYVPDFEIDDFDENHFCEYSNMKYYCLMPGVVNADKTLLSSEQLRKVYIKKLIEFAGEETKDLWEGKIVLFDSYFSEILEKIDSKDLENISNNKNNISKKKIILFYTGISNWVQYKEKMIEKIENTLKIFDDNKDNINVIWKIDPMTEEVIKMCAKECFEEYKILLEKFEKMGIGTFCDEKSDDELVEMCDAFYGDSDAIIRRFERTEKPIMIENIWVKK